MKRTTFFATLTAMTCTTLAVLGINQTVHGDNMLDDFESYTLQLPEGLTEGANYLSAGGDMSIHHLGPTWNRFGAAVADGLFVSNRPSEILSGLQSGTAFANWNAGDVYSAVYLAGGMNVQGHLGYRIDIRSNGSTGVQDANAIATFAGTNGQIWIADLNQISASPITGSVQTLTFAFNEADFMEVNQPEPDADFLGTLGSLDWIGIQIRQGGSTGEEAFSIDNLALTPEPASVAMLGIGLLMIGRRSKNRNA